MKGLSYNGWVSECQRPLVTYPTRVPMKIIGRAMELKPQEIADLIFQHLRLMPAPSSWREELQFSEHLKGAWISYTFWVILPDEYVEKPLREAIQLLPGVVTQL